MSSELREETELVIQPVDPSPRILKKRKSVVSDPNLLGTKERLKKRKEGNLENPRWVLNSEDALRLNYKKKSLILARRDPTIP